MDLHRSLPALFVLLSMLGAPCRASTASLHGVLYIGGPVSGHAKAQHLPGTIAESNGNWHLTFSYVDPTSDKQLPKPDTLDYSPSGNTLSYDDARAGKVTALAPTALASVTWSAIPEDANGLGAFLLLGKTLPQKAHLIGTQTYHGLKVQAYSFKESKDVIGQVLYAPDYGIPVSLDVWDLAKQTHEFVHIEHIQG